MAPYLAMRSHLVRSCFFPREQGHTPWAGKTQEEACGDLSLRVERVESQLVQSKAAVFVFRRKKVQCSVKSNKCHLYEVVGVPSRIGKEMVEVLFYPFLGYSTLCTHPINRDCSRLTSSNETGHGILGDTWGSSWKGSATVG